MKSVVRWAQAEDLELLIVYPSERAVSFIGEQALLWKMM
jgi:hypothetical protein